MPQLSFESKLLADQGAHFVPVPAEVVDRLGPERRRPVRVTLKAHSYLAMIAVNGGRHFIGVRHDVVEAAGLRPGEALIVALEYEQEDMTGELPADIRAAIEGNHELLRTFEALATGQKKEVVAWIREAKRPETRLRRLRQALAMFGSRRRGA